MPKVSVIVPFYNAEAYLQRSVSSALSQTEPDLEVICVDDGSTDQGAQVVARLAQEDARVRLVALECNEGRLAARLAGIEAAQGEFVMFLDADDELDAQAASTALRAQGKRHSFEGGAEGFDIVQFNFAMRYEHPVSPELRAFNEAFARPPAAEAFGDDVAHVVFRDRRTTWSLCGKLMRASIVKDAAAWVAHNVEEPLQAAEDACLYFVIASKARSYKGMPDYAGYVYHIDIGGSGAGATSMTFDEFTRDCCYADAMAAIGRYADACCPQLGVDAEVVRYEHLLALSDKALHVVEPAARPAAFDALAGAWSVPDAVAGIADAGWDDPAGALAAVAGAQTLTCAPRRVKTVAAYHYRMGHGGAERVCAELLELWSSMGFDVVLLADEGREACAYDVPDAVTWVQLPSTESVERDTYAVRARALAAALAEHEVDVLVHHQWWNRLLCWDTLVAKASGVAVCAYMHSVFTVLFREGRPAEMDVCRVLRHADGVVAMSQTDARFWQQFAPRVWTTCNPPTFRCADVQPAPLDGTHVVWVGRLTPWDKQPQEAVEVFTRVHASCPDAVLDLVGPADDASFAEGLKQRCAELGISAAVRFVGATDDVAAFYRGASVHLVTSAYDGWCLALAESKAFGLPCVMYEMPYLTLTQGNRGIVAVPQGDRDAAARAVVDLLENEDERRARGAEARAHAEELEGFDYRGLWEGVFAELAQGSPERTGFEDADEQWDLTIDVFKAALGAARADGAHEIEGSRTYRLGDALARVPRLMRRLAVK